MKFRKFALGALTTAATIVAPNTYAEEKKSSDDLSSKTPQEILWEKKNDLHDVVKGRFEETNPKTAISETSKTMSEASSLLSLNDTIYNNYMEMLHDNFENKEVHAERVKAYTVQKGDNEKLTALKKEAKRTYDECLRELERLNKADAALKRYLKDHPEANDSISANDSLEDFDKSPKNPLNADKKLLELQLKHANTMKDLMVKQDELAKIDVPLRIAQLNQDIFNKKAQLQQVKKDIKEWDRLQKEIDVLQGELSALTLGDFDNEAKSKLSDDQDKNNEVTDQNLTTAQENWDKNQKAQGLDTEIKKYKGLQLKLGESRDTLVNTQTRLNGEIKDHKNELKRLRKINGDHEIEAFTKDAYEGSTLQLTANDFAQAYKENKNAQSQAVENDTISEYQAKISQYRQNAEKEVTEELENGVKQTYITLNEKGVKREVTTIEYPNGKSVIFDGNDVLSYKNGELNQSYKFKDNQYTDIKGNTVSAADVMRIVGSGNLR